MPFNVLLLPLLGGYIFVTHWNRTRFAARRYTGERLIFHAATAGVAFLAVAFLLVLLISSVFPPLPAWWQANIPFAYAGTSFLAFTLGAISPWPLNAIFKPDGEVERVIEDRGDFLEVLLRKAMTETKQVAISLKSGKVYIGFVTSGFDPAYDRKYMRLLPTLSGYRSLSDQTMIVTTDYVPVYLQITRGDNKQLLGMSDDFQVVIPISEIRSANIFDPNIYSLFNPDDSEAEEYAPLF